MGRELRRKQAKREGKNVREVQKINKSKPLSPKTFVVIMTVLLLFFAILGVLTAQFITHEINLFGKDKEEIVTPIENQILAIDSLRQSEEIYYVYYYDVTKEDNEVYSAVNSLTDKVYRVNLNDELNSNFVGDPSGVVEDINNLKVSDPTVIKVSSEKIEAFYSGIDEIKSSLK